MIVSSDSQSSDPQINEDSSAVISTLIRPRSPNINNLYRFHSVLRMFRAKNFTDFCLELNSLSSVSLQSGSQLKFVGTLLEQLEQS